jgi:tetratricopeptide (TPR) repeat protein
MRTRRVLNTPLFVGTLVAIAILMAGAYAWRAVQVKRNAKALLDRAEALAEDKDFDAAAAYLFKYLQLRPDAPDRAEVKVRLAQVYDKAAVRDPTKIQRATELYNDALVTVPAEEAVGLHARLAELLLELEDFGAAKLEARALLEANERDPRGWRLLASAVYGQFQLGNLAPAKAEAEESLTAAEKKAGIQAAKITAVGTAFERAHQLDPADIGIAVSLARIYAGHPELVSDEQLAKRARTEPSKKFTPDQQQRLGVAAADQVIQEMMDANPKRPAAYLARYVYLTSFKVPRAKGNEQEDLRAAATRDLADALRYGPNDPQILLAAGAAALQEAALAAQRGKVEEAGEHNVEARRHYEQAIKVAIAAEEKYLPEIAYLGLARTWEAQRDSERAMETLRKGLAQSEGKSIRLNWALADQLIDQGQIKEALRILDGLDSTLKAANFSARSSLQRLTDFRRARLLFRQADYAAAIPLLTALAAGPKVTGDEYADRRSKIEPREIYQAWFLLGNAQAALKRWDEALVAYDRAAKLEPAATEPLLRAAAACAAANRPAIAVGYLEQALATESSGREEGQGPRAMIYQQLIALLEKDQSRRAEVDRYRGLLEKEVAASAELSRWEIDRAVRQGKPDRALAVAQSGIVRRPKDPLAHIALGQAWWANDQKDKAEVAFKQAVELAPDTLLPLGVLFAFYARADQSDNARRMLQTIAENPKFTATQRALAPAMGYELLGDRERAKAGYREAARLDPEKPDYNAVQMRLATFLLKSGDRDDALEAEKVLRGVLEHAPHFAPARYTLAEALLERGGEQEWQEAQRLAEQAGPNGDGSIQDRRMQAVLLARRAGKANLEKARQILEQQLLENPREAGTFERLWLARIQESEGNLPEARQQYSALANLDGARPEHIGRYVDFLLRRGTKADGPEIATWLKKLDQAAPDDLATAALRARWLQDQGRAGEIEPLVEPLAGKLLGKLGNDQKAQADLILAVGNVYTGLREFATAERWYRRLIKLSPERYGPVAMSLAGQGRIQEAIAVCDEAAKTDHSLRPVMTMTGVLLSGHATAEDIDRAEPLLKKAVEPHAKDAGLLMNLGAIQVVRGNAAAAADYYRQVLKQQPDNSRAMNNLATVLAEQDDPARRREALECIDRAIKLVGPQAPLLDTKGMILIYEQKYDEAVDLLQQATAVPRADPRYSFHLAVAYHGLNDLDKARAALQQARKGDLTHQILTTKDRDMLAKLQQKLGP